MAITNGLIGIEEMKTVGEIDGATPDIITPAVQGAFYVIPVRLPDMIFSQKEKQELEEIFRVLVNKVTLPGVTLATAETTYGFSGATKVSAPTNIDVTNEVTIGFNEQQGFPVINFIEKWVYAIRDPHTGLSRVSDYTLANISGDFLVVMTKPVYMTANPIEENGVSGYTLDNIERAVFFRNIYPTRVPLDTLSPNKENSDKIAYDLVWKFKNMINNEYTKALALEQLMRFSDNVSTWDTVKPVA